MKAGDVDRFEVNDAFAAIALVVRDGLKIDPARFNADGGAIAHGHPIGATGAILVTKVTHALKRTGGRKAVVSLCIGGGQRHRAVPRARLSGGSGRPSSSKRASSFAARWAM